MFTVSVEYKREEYLAITKQMLALEWGKKWISHKFFDTTSNFILSLVFWLKVQRDSKCTYEFSESCLTRKTSRGMSTISWDSLRRVWVLKDAYLIVGRKRGMAPVPKRCLSNQQVEMFERFAENKLARK